LPNEMPQSFIIGLVDALNSKVDKVTGKGLSANDFTTALKNKLDGLQNYVHPEFHQIGEIDGLTDALNDKQDKVEGKGLSTNDFTNDYKEQLDNPVEVPENLSGFTDDIGATETEIIKVRTKDQIINQDLDASKVYKLMNSISIDGLTEKIRIDNLKKLLGLGHNDTTITITGENGIGFVSAGNGRNIDIENLQISTVGTGSKCFDVTDVDGSHEMRLLSVNFSGCKSLGDVRDYRQVYWNDIGLYGCADGVTFHGEMNGAYINGLNLFSFQATGTLFKEGDDLSFSNRLFAALNFDVPTGAKLLDFQPGVFLGNELLQLNGCIAKVNGVLNPEATTALVPNISANDSVCKWTGNTGLHNSSIERFIEDTDVSGNFEVSWLVDTYYLEMTADTTFTERDLPANGKNTKEILIYLTGEFTPTFPAGWIVNQVGTYKGADVNEIRIKNIKTGVYFTRISNSLSVYPAPDLSSVDPSGFLPNTQDNLINLYGSFFTPQSIVEIEGQTVTAVDFKNSGWLQVVFDTNALEGDFDITISNGTTVIFRNRIAVVLGEVTTPVEADWDIITGGFDHSNGIDAIKQQTINPDESVWEGEFDYTQDFQVRVDSEYSPLGFSATGSDRWVLEDSSGNSIRMENRGDGSSNLIINGTFYAAGRVSSGQGTYTSGQITIRNTGEILVRENGSLRSGLPTLTLGSNFKLKLLSRRVNYYSVKYILLAN